MKDVYPALDALPTDCLVPVELQPEYLACDNLGPMTDLADALADRHVAAGRGEAVAIIHHEGRRAITYRDLSETSSRLANVLGSLGCRAGDRVAFRSGNRPEAIIAALAAWRIGAVVVPTPVQAREAELRFFLQDTGARFMLAEATPESMDGVEAAVGASDVETGIAFGGQIDRFHDWSTVLAEASPVYGGPPPELDAPALIWHTGGTTGTPKACYHTQRRYLLGGYSVGLSTGVRPGQRWAAAAPMGHALGFIYHTNFTLQHGATIVLIEQFAKPDAVLRAIQTHRIDTFTSVVALWARLKDALEAEPAEYDVSSLRRAYGMWQSASSAQVTGWWRERGLTLMNNFGSTSFATWVLVPRPREPFGTGSLGRPSPGYEVIASDSATTTIKPVPSGTAGRMAVRGPTGLTYWNRLELQERDVLDGWTMVDDLIRLDEHGNADYLGRTDYVISTAGYKVAPVEVEQVLCRHPDVREVAVVGAPDPIRQEIVVAFVALNEGLVGGDDLRRELQGLVKVELSPYKYPRRIKFIDALPRDGVGKVQMKHLVERARCA